MLDTEDYLKSQGWKGKGSGLKAGSRANPILIAQKKTLSGVGKDSFNSFNWWDSLFAGVAKKLQDGPQNDNDQPRRTTTGIFSPLPKPEGVVVQPVTGLAKHQDVMSSVRKDAARATLYSSFLRGKILEPEPSIDCDATTPTTMSVSSTREPTPDAEDTISKPQRKRKMIEMEDGSFVEETKEQRRQRRKLRKIAKEVKPDS